MDNNTISSIQSIITNIEGSMSGQQAQLNIFKEVLTIAKQGWQSDVEKALSSIQPQLDQLARERDEALSQAADLSTQLSDEQAAHIADNGEKDAIIIDLQAQLSVASAPVDPVPVDPTPVDPTPTESDVAVS